jgi:hypothetical protein
MLSTPHEEFATHAARDRRNPDIVDWDSLVREKAGWIGRELTHQVTLDRHQASQAAIDRLSEALAEAAPDVLVIVGDDQEEWFSAENTPAICVYWGDSVEVLPPPIEQVARRSSYWGYYGDGANRAFPVEAALAYHLIESLTVEAGFDVAQMRDQPRHGPLGHAWCFIFQRIMRDQVIPIVPVLLNCFYPPNQPTPRRCYELGRAIRRSVEAWDADKKVAVVASGGLSHFLVDEGLDRAVLRAIEARDVEAVARLPREQLNSGNSEIRNWIVAAGATEHLRMELVDYIPGYRSEAGSGVGLAFATWT